jgi:hypothetical protein
MCGRGALLRRSDIPAIERWHGEKVRLGLARRQRPALVGALDAGALHLLRELWLVP